MPLHTFAARLRFATGTLHMAVGSLRSLHWMNCLQCWWPLVLPGFVLLVSVAPPRGTAPAAALIGNVCMLAAP